MCCAILRERARATQSGRTQRQRSGDDAEHTRFRRPDLVATVSRWRGHRSGREAFNGTDEKNLDHHVRSARCLGFRIVVAHLRQCSNTRGTDARHAAQWVSLTFTNLNNKKARRRRCRAGLTNMHACPSDGYNKPFDAPRSASCRPTDLF